MIHKVLNFMIRLKQGAPLGLSWYTKYASWSLNLRYRMRIATYILIYFPIYSCLLVEYSTEKCLFLGVSKYEKGVGYVYSKSKGRGHDNFFLGNPPVFSFATVRKYPESAPALIIYSVLKSLRSSKAHSKPHIVLKCFSR